MKNVMWGALLVFNQMVVAETVYVTLEKDNALAVVDPITGKLLKTVPVGQRPRGIVLSKDQQQLYIATSDDDTIQIIDIASFSTDQKKVYTTNGVSSDMSIIDLSSMKVTKSIAVGRYPWGIVVKP